MFPRCLLIVSICFDLGDMFTKKCCSSIIFDEERLRECIPRELIDELGVGTDEHNLV
ncbi:hypothetical protein KTH_54560 [Thermosporothrix hazakensis]|nr:hypothetical protein KTH_54560 [Thermosporothrix hazakensis]